MLRSHCRVDNTRRPGAPGARRRVSGLAVLLTIASLFMFASSASATVMTYQDTADLVEISDAIVHGEVVDQRTYFDKQQGFVVTDVTLKVKHTFLGKATDTVTFQQWGGDYDGQRRHIPGDATFTDGEEVVVFLHTKDGITSLSALGQAKYAVKRNGDQSLVLRSLAQMAFLEVGTDGSQRVDHRADEQYTFESFTAELEALVAGIKGGNR